MKKPKRGEIVRVKFWDHAKGGSKVSPHLCEVYGVVTAVEGIYIRIVAWNTTTDEGDETNFDAFAILTSTIEEMEKLSSVV